MTTVIAERPREWTWNSIEKLMAKVEPDTNGGCWLWTAYLNKKGYAAIMWNRKRTYVHRLMYEHFVGSIPEGLCVLHRCDTPMCVNPAHMFLGTKADNANDRHNKGRTAHGESHCRAKLRESDVLAIRSAYADGAGLSELARRFDLKSVATVLQVVRRETWKHL